MTKRQFWGWATYGRKMGWKGKPDQIRDRYIKESLALSGQSYPEGDKLIQLVEAQTEKGTPGWFIQHWVPRPKCNLAQ